MMVEVAVVMMLTAVVVIVGIMLAMVINMWFLVCLTTDLTLNSMVGNVTARSPDRRAILVYSIPPESITAMDKDNKPINASNGDTNFTV